MLNTRERVKRDRHHTTVPAVGHGRLEEMLLSDHTSGNLLLLRLQRNRRTCHNVAGLRSEDFHSTFPIVGEIRLRLPTQFFQPLSHLLTARLTSTAMFTIRMVDSQEGQQGAHPHPHVHNPPRWDSWLFVSGVLRLNRGSRLRRSAAT